jgi:hypothetical protein
VREFLCAFLAGIGAFWLGTLQFGVLYHPMHDYLKVHSELTTVVFLSIYAIIVYTADRHNKNPLARPGSGIVQLYLLLMRNVIAVQIYCIARCVEVLCQIVNAILLQVVAGGSMSSRSPSA